MVAPPDVQCSVRKCLLSGTYCPGRIVRDVLCRDVSVRDVSSETYRERPSPELLPIIPTVHSAWDCDCIRPFHLRFP